MLSFQLIGFFRKHSLISMRAEGRERGVKTVGATLHQVLSRRDLMFPTILSPIVKAIETQDQNWVAKARESDAGL